MLAIYFPTNIFGFSMSPKLMVSVFGEFFRKALREQINLKYLRVRLADLIDWGRIDTVCSKHLPSRRNRPATAPRSIAGLLYVQHAFDLSDESVVRGWVVNFYRPDVSAG